MNEYRRVEMSFAAVDTEHLDALRRDYLAMRNKYSAGGSLLGVESLHPGTVINRIPDGGSR